MYSQYIDGIFSPLQTTAPTDAQSVRRGKVRDPSPGKSQDGLRNLLGGILKQFSASNFDSGDILLILILLFLFLEGDNLEMVITLGLIFFLGLTDDHCAT